MKGYTRTSILILIIAAHVTTALGPMKVLHIPEKIIGGVIDIVQSHKNRPSQQAVFQGQSQQQAQQGYGWNSGYQGQNQNQAQNQYGNYGTYPQGGYVNPSQGAGSGYQQQNYPQTQPTGQYQVQNQQSSGQQSNQFQNQIQNGFQGQQTQIQVQNQVNGQFSNQNPQTNLNIQGTQHVINQPVDQNNPSGSYGSGQNLGTFVNNQQTGNYVGQQQTSNHYGVPNNQGQNTQSTSFVGQNHQTTHFQTGTGSYGGSQGFQTSTGHHYGIPGPTCVCQTFTKPQKDALTDTPSQRNDVSTEKSVASE